MPSSPRISASGSDVSRGWPGRLRSWKRRRAHRQRRRLGHAEALVADEQGRVAARPDHEHRLLEARVEPGEVGDVGAVLAIGPHDEPVVAALVPCARASAPAALGEDRRRQQRLDGRHAEVGQLDVGQHGLPLCGSHSCTSSLIGGRHGPRRRLVRAALDDRELVGRAASSTDRPRRRATARGRRRRSASPSPTMEPAELAAGVPAADGHLVRHWVRSPTRTSTHAPIASTFGAGWLSRTASQSPIAAGCVGACRSRRCATPTPARRG